MYFYSLRMNWYVRPMTKVLPLFFCILFGQTSPPFISFWRILRVRIATPYLFGLLQLLHMASLQSIGTANKVVDIKSAQFGVGRNFCTIPSQFFPKEIISCNFSLVISLALLYIQTSLKSMETDNRYISIYLQW